MRKSVSIFFFLLIGQFCVYAQNWQSVGSGLPGYVGSMVADSANHKIYASGYWSAWHRFLQYNDSNGVWSPLGNNTVPGNTYTITIYRGEIYGAAPSGVYKLIGATWQCVAPANSAVVGLIQNDTSLYAYGMFDSIAGIPALKIARFDGTSWNNIGTIPVSNDIYCAAFYQGDLYVGGNIINSTLGCYKIIKWNGNQWDTLPGSINRFTGGFDWIDCLTVYNNKLYVGGYFSYSQGGNPGDNIAIWDGNTWTGAGGGVDFQVVAMQVYNGELWVGGSFTSAGGVPSSDIAKWNGTDWCNVGNFDNTVDCFMVFNGELYAGGGHWTVDGDSVNKVVKWIGGSNTNGCGHLNTGIAEQSEQNSVAAFPNPASDQISFLFNNLAPDQISITDQLGRQVIERKLNGEKQIEISVSDFANGMYFYKILNGETEISGKFIVHH